MYSRKDTIRLKIVGSPIRKSLDQRLRTGSPKHIGVSPVLLRLLVPRHPPCALSNLTNLLLRSKGCFSDFRISDDTSNQMKDSLSDDSRLLVS